MHPTNTAGDRLYQIIHAMYQAPQNESLLRAWARVLKLPEVNKLEAFRGLLSVGALVDEVETNVRKRGGKPTELYTRSLDQVRNVLMVNFETHRSSLNNLLKPEVVTDLEHCAAMYSEIDSEIPVPQEQIDSIKTQVNELFDEIAKSAFPEELRSRLLDLLEVIRQQISQFEIRGVTALHECLRQSLARLIEIYPAIQHQGNDPLLKRVIGVISGIGKICENAQKALPIIKVAAKLLPILAHTNNHMEIPEIADIEVLSK